MAKLSNQLTRHNNEEISWNKIKIFPKDSVAYGHKKDGTYTHMHLCT